MCFSYNNLKAHAFTVEAVMHAVQNRSQNLLLSLDFFSDATSAILPVNIGFDLRHRVIVMYVFYGQVSAKFMKS